jgi:hypothetical protein
MSDVLVERCDIMTEPAHAFIAARNAERSARYPEDGASRSGKPVGCGATRRISDGTGEVKRMYVVSPRRSRCR